MMAQSRECIGGEIGVECKGTHENIQMCNEEQCPKWMAWSQWSSCSVTCGKGVRSRSRECSGDASMCSGDNKEVQFCGSNECRKYCNVVISVACTSVVSFSCVDCME